MLHGSTEPHLYAHRRRRHDRARRRRAPAEVRCARRAPMAKSTNSIASIGLARLTTSAPTTPTSQAIDETLARAQNDLFDLGADLCVPPKPYEEAGAALRMTPSQVEALERAIDALNADLAPLKSFVLPGGSPAAAALHQARTVCRRAERAIVALAAAEGENVGAPVARLCQPPLRLSVRRRALRQQARRGRHLVGSRREPLRERTAKRRAHDLLSVPPRRPLPSLPIEGDERRYPVSRIFCVGRNYEDHAKEMGHVVDREKPFYFLKSATALRQNGETIPYPPGTTNYHFEVELVVAHRRARVPIAEGRRARRGLRLCLRPRHDAPRPAAFRARQAAAVDARQGRRGRARRPSADRARRADRPSRQGGDHAEAERRR